LARPVDTDTSPNNVCWFK